MGADCEDAVKQLSHLMEQVEAPLKRSFQKPTFPDGGGSWARTTGSQLTVHP